MDYVGRSLYRRLTLTESHPLLWSSIVHRLLRRLPSNISCRFFSKFSLSKVLTSGFLSKTAVSELQHSLSVAAMVKSWVCRVKMALQILVARVENAGLPLAGGKVTNSVIVALIRIVLCHL